MSIFIMLLPNLIPLHTWTVLMVWSAEKRSDLTIRACGSSTAPGLWRFSFQRHAKKDCLAIRISSDSTSFPDKWAHLAEQGLAQRGRSLRDFIGGFFSYQWRGSKGLLYWDAVIVGAFMLLQGTYLYKTFHNKDFSRSLGNSFSTYTFCVNAGYN